MLAMSKHVFLCLQLNFVYFRHEISFIYTKMLIVKPQFLNSCHLEKKRKVKKIIIRRRKIIFVIGNHCQLSRTKCLQSTSSDKEIFWKITFFSAIIRFCSRICWFLSANNAFCCCNNSNLDWWYCATVVTAGSIVAGNLDDDGSDCVVCFPFADVMRTVQFGVGFEADGAVDGSAATVVDAADVILGPFASIG